MVEKSSEPRPLTSDEHQLIKWMLEHGHQDALSFLPQLAFAQAIDLHCLCGCASFNLVLQGKQPPAKSAGLHILGEFMFGPADRPSGIFLFEKEGDLAGVEIYGWEDQTPASLPTPENLLPLS